MFRSLSHNNNAAGVPPLERIVGPVHGHYLAIYTVSGGDGYFGYAKVCAHRPDSAWDGTPVVRKVAAGPFPTELSAMKAVSDKAQAELLEMLDFQLLWEEAGPPSAPRSRAAPPG
jgi:hypothetical protein